MAHEMHPFVWTKDRVSSVFLGEYWDKDIMRHEGTFDPYGWMIDDRI